MTKNKTERFEQRITIGSTAILENISNQVRLKVLITEENIQKPTINCVVYTSVLGCELIGLSLGDVANINYLNEEGQWMIISINNGS